MYCPSCGRENQVSDCIHTVKYGQKDEIFLIILIMLIPSTLYAVFFQMVHDYDLINYLEVGSLSVSIILIILLIAYYVFHKLYIVIFFGCHQKVSRSIQANKQPFILCARCTGIMVGMFLTYFISLFNFNYFWLFILLIPLIIDGVLQAKTNYVSNNIKRFVTGFLSAPSFVILFGGFHYLLAKYMLELVLKIL